MTEKTTEDLLKEAQSLLHPSGRKKRVDKGKSHSYPSERVQSTKPRRPRKDKGKKRNEYPEQTPMHIYNRVKARIYKQDEELIARNELPLLRGFDENGYYIVIPASYQIKQQNYQQVIQGRKIEHTLRRIQVQKEIDLEYYRFEAWQYMAKTYPNEIVPQCPELMVMLDCRYNLLGTQAKQAIQNRQINWFFLFTEFYHLRVGDAFMWDYETWRNMYSYCPCQLLDDDFTFSLTKIPGTPEFHPEWAYHKDKLDKQQEEAREQEIARKRQQFISHWRSKQNN